MVRVIAFPLSLYYDVPMPTELLNSVEINPSQTPTASLILMHGLGADGHDFANIVPQLGLSDKLPIRFVFPHAPVRPITINGGYAMRAWYDIIGLEAGTREDEVGVRESALAIEALIEREIARGIPSQRIILAGFSQGGAMALHCGLRYAKPLAGVLGLSTYLPLASKVPVEVNVANKALPIFMAHGTQDPILPLAWAELSRDVLQNLGHSVEFHVYPMAHSVCMDEVRDISLWLQKVLV